MDRRIFILCFILIFGAMALIAHLSNNERNGLIKVDETIFIDEYTGVVYYFDGKGLNFIYNTDGTLKCITKYNKSEILKQE